MLRGWRLVTWLGILVATIWLARVGLPDGRLHVYFLDVGEGDAIFVQAPDGRQILVDGGPDPVALLNELGKVMPFWDRDLDLVVLTHPDTDHLTGLIAVLERYQVAGVLDSHLSDAAPAAQVWRDTLDARHVPRVLAEAGMRLPVGALEMTVLSAAPAEPSPRLSTNNGCLVLRLEHGETSFLLMGDAEMAAESALLQTGRALHADILKVGHHGSRSSTSPSFLTAVTPSLAVIQAGAGNRFEHPHPELLARLAGIPILRTDRDGQVEISGDGKRLWASAERANLNADGSRK